MPKVLQLAKNFRSHARILDLANSVVSLVELLFPKTIDKLMKETSDLRGPKPVVIEAVGEKAMQKLFAKYLLWWSGSGEPASPRPSDPSTEGRSQFGCDKVVIVRDQNSKKLVPSYLKELLCLTVYEAKGLEFDDVILFNFFHDSKCGSQWKILNDVRAKQELVKVITKKFLDFEELDCSEDPESE